MIKFLRKQYDENRIYKLPVNMIAPNPNQPRKYFDDEMMAELVASVKKYGVLQPVTVRRVNNEYELISGERRFRACQLAGIKKIPAIVIDADVKKSAELALLENLQREDLTFFEVAESYKNLVRSQGMSKREIAEDMGKSETDVGGRIRLLELPTIVKKLIRDYNLSEGHAKTLLSLTDERQQLEAAKKVCLDNLNLSQTKDLVAAMQEDKPRQYQKVHISKIKDIRIFKNTIERALKVVKNGGVDAEMKEKNFDWGTEYVIRIKSKDKKGDIKKEEIIQLN